MCRKRMIAVLVLLAAAAGVIYAQVKSELLWGFWYNKDNVAEYYAYEYHSDGTAAVFNGPGSTPSLVARYKIVEEWTDDANNTWYKVSIAWGTTLPAGIEGPNVWSLLMKIDPTGKVLEDQAVRGNEFPAGMVGQVGGWHQLYYRNE